MLRLSPSGQGTATKDARIDAEAVATLVSHRGEDVGVDGAGGGVDVDDDASLGGPGHVEDGAVDPSGQASSDPAILGVVSVVVGGVDEDVGPAPFFLEIAPDHATDCCDRRPTDDADVHGVGGVAPQLDEVRGVAFSRGGSPAWHIEEWCAGGAGFRDPGNGAASFLQELQ